MRSTLEAPDARNWIPLDIFAREAGMSPQAVVHAFHAGNIRGVWRAEVKGTPACRFYFVGDLPETCGSPLLLDYLLRVEQQARHAQQEAQAAIDRVVLHRRSRRAA